MGESSSTPIHEQKNSDHLQWPKEKQLSHIMSGSLKNTNFLTEFFSPLSLSVGIGRHEQLSLAFAMVLERGKQ